LRGPDGRTSPVALTGAGLPLGLGSGSYEPTVLTLREPALLALYTDGLVESRGADIDQEITRLAHALDAAAAESVDADDADEQGALPALCERILRTSSGAAGTDDRTLLLAELTPAG
jgi:hypothetical protein